MQGTKTTLRKVDWRTTAALHRLLDVLWVDEDGGLGPRQPWLIEEKASDRLVARGVSDESSGVDQHLVALLGHKAQQVS